MSDHYHYGEYAEARHDHRGEYADERHDHDLEYAEKHHRHYDDERAVDELRQLLGEVRAALAETREDLSAALKRIRQLEEQTPEARQAEYEADVALADARGGEAAPYTGPCCWRAAYDDSIGWWCQEHGDQP